MGNVPIHAVNGEIACLQKQQHLRVYYYVFEPVIREFPETSPHTCMT